MRKLYLLLLISAYINLCANDSANGQTTALLSIEGFGGNHFDRIENHVVATDDGGFIIKISSLPFTTGNIPDCHNGINNYQNLFRKYDATGTTLEWQRCYTPMDIVTDSAIQYIFPASNGNFYAIGVFGTTVGAGGNFFLSLEDAAQNRIWSGPGYGGVPGLYLNTVCRSDDGGFFLAFKSEIAGGDVPSHYGSSTFADIWLLKLDSTGHQQWNKVIGGSYADIPYRVLPAPNGGCYVVGLSASVDYDGIGNNGNTDAFAAKVDSSGNIVWRRSMGGAEYDYAYDAIDDGNGALYLAGAAGADGANVHNHHGGAEDFWLVKMDTSGAVFWDNCYGSSFGEAASAICKSTDGSIWLTGYSHTQGQQVDTGYGTVGDSWTVHADANGNYISGKVLGWNYYDETKMIYPLPGGIVLVGGGYDGPAPVGGEFLTNHFGDRDVFLARLAAWTTSTHKIELPEVICNIYPNPSDNVVYIDVQGKRNAAYKVSLVDAQGKTINTYSVESRNKLTIPTSQMSKGVYYILIRDKNGVKHGEKIILE